MTQMHTHTTNRSKMSSS